MNQKHRVVHVVGAAIFDDDGRVLVAQRSAKMSHPWCWEFPGGKIEEGESPHEALRREVYEELNLVVEPGACVAQGRETHSDKIVVLDVFFARLVHGQISLREHAQVMWCMPGELLGLHFAMADMPAVQLLARLAPHDA